MSSPFKPVEPEEKLWELLRRNELFRAEVQELQALEARSKMGGQSAEGPRDEARNRFESVRKINPIAALALQWLVPQPVFEVREYTRTLSGPPDLVLLGWGLTPDPSDPSWKWFQKGNGPRGSPESKANRRGWPVRRGPTITRRILRGAKRARTIHDGVAEWQDYFKHRSFTVDSEWSKSPVGFRQSFAALWQKVSGAGAAGYETQFFQDWDLSDLLLRVQGQIQAANQCILDLVKDLDRVRRGLPETVCPPTTTRAGNSLRRPPTFPLNFTEPELARMRMFGDLSKHRVLAIRPPLTQEQAKEAFGALLQEVSSALPTRFELMGTEGTWKNFLGVEAIRRAEGSDLGTAIHLHIRRSRETRQLLKHETDLPTAEIDRWFKQGEIRKPADGSTRRDQMEFERVRSRISPVLRRADAAQRTTVKARVEHIQRLITAAYPRFEVAELTRRQRHERKRTR